jgi:ABC-type branched-subunit amino acid transport system ATPase component/ABC-type branched-subunit amino acid transport system permease subunit
LDQHAVFLLLGLANGAVFAALALALVVTYRSSGVLNFATGATALLSAYIYAFLRTGELILLVPGLPRSIDLGRPLPFGAAVALTLIADVAFGLLLYVSTFRPLRAASPVAKAVASIGVMVVVTGLITERVGSAAVAVNPIFPTRIWTIGSIRVSSDRVWLALTIVAITSVVVAGYRYTRFGLHTRAAAETEKGAYVARISPDRIAAANWAIGSAIAGLAGILIAPVTPLVPFSYTLFIVPALAAAIVGGFENVGLAVATGLAIGMLQSELTYLRTQHQWLPSSGLAELVPLALILIALVVRAKPLPSRGEILRTGLARVPRPEHLTANTVSGLMLGVVAIFAVHGSWRSALVTTFAFAIIALSMVVVTGLSGQVSLAQLTLAGVAAFLLSPVAGDWGVPFPFAPVVAALGATVIGVVVGIPALRIRGLPVAIVTLSLAVAVQAIWFQNIDLVGSSGKAIAAPSLFGIDLGPGSGAAYPRPQFCLMVLVVLVLTALGVAYLRRSRLGSAMLAVRANERSAAASGVNVVATKILAFAIAAFVAGIGGSMYGYRLGTVTWDSFDVLLGLGLFATVYVAGMTSVSGGVLAGALAAGGFVYYAGTQWLSLDIAWYQILTGIALVLSVVKNPEGLVGNVHRIIERRRARRSQLDTLATPPPVATVSRPPRVAPETRDEAALAVANLSVRYGGVVAVDDVSFTVPSGAIVGLIGPNGAGKTTVIDAVSGFCRYGGTVELHGTRLEREPPHRRNRLGLARTFQGIELWNELTVAENVLVGRSTAARGSDDSDALFAVLQLDGLRDHPAGALSQGQRQLVSIARALIGRPRVVLLDEPAAGLDSNESAWLAQRLRDIRDAGTTVLLVDHDMNLVLNLCDRIEVLDFGQVIASGTAAEIRSNHAVAEAYLGTTHAAPEVSAR